MAHKKKTTPAVDLDTQEVGLDKAAGASLDAADKSLSDEVRTQAAGARQKLVDVDTVTERRRR